MADHQTSMSTVHLQHLAYHLRTAVALGLNGEQEECLSEVLLSWVLLSVAADDVDTAASQATLTSPLPVSATMTARRRAAERARALALELEAHFVSLGRGEEVELYRQISDVADENLTGL